jgi:hypothetical protein
MKFRLAVVVFSVVALAVGVASATAGGGNSANAKQCQKNGWMSLIRSDGTSFTSEEDCVSYAAQGGTLAHKTQSQLDCESFGGTFSIRTDAPFVWQCDGIPNLPPDGSVFSSPAYITLHNDCIAWVSPAAPIFKFATTSLNPVLYLGICGAQ